VYISYLLAFRGLARTLDSADAVRARLRGVPAPVLDGLLARFAEAARGSTACAPLRLCAVRPLTRAQDAEDGRNGDEAADAPVRAVPAARRLRRRHRRAREGPQHDRPRVRLLPSWLVPR
jgi:hypothetical protein